MLILDRRQSKADSTDAQIPVGIAEGQILEATTNTIGQYVLVVIENQGFLPTYVSHQSKKRKSARPVRMALNPPGHMHPPTATWVRQEHDPRLEALGLVEVHDADHG